MDLGTDTSNSSEYPTGHETAGASKCCGKPEVCKEHNTMADINY
jgi:hypothetical protein